MGSGTVGVGEDEPRRTSIGLCQPASAAAASCSAAKPDKEVRQRKKERPNGGEAPPRLNKELERREKERRHRGESCPAATRLNNETQGSEEMADRGESCSATATAPSRCVTSHRRSSWSLVPRKGKAQCSKRSAARPAQQLRPRAEWDDIRHADEHASHAPRLGQFRHSSASASASPASAASSASSSASARHGGLLQRARLEPRADSLKTRRGKEMRASRLSFFTLEPRADSLDCRLADPVGEPTTGRSAAFVLLCLASAVVLAAAVGEPRRGGARPASDCVGEDGLCGAAGGEPGVVAAHEGPPSVAVVPGGSSSPS